MINKQILEKVIEKAVKNGWNIASLYADKITKKYMEDMQTKEFDRNFKMFCRCRGIEWKKWEIAGNYKTLFGGVRFDFEVCTVIFSHSFAKSFWGEEETPGVGVAWQYHLQYMVLEKEPLKYLEKFL